MEVVLSFFVCHSSVVVPCYAVRMEIPTVHLHAVCPCPSCTDELGTLGYRRGYCAVVC